MSSEEALSSVTRGRKTLVKKTTLDVDSTEKIVANSNPSRIAIFFGNLTVNNVSIGFDNRVTTLIGFALDALGGILSFNRREDGNIPELEFHAIAAADNTSVVMLEVIEIGDKNKL